MIKLRHGASNVVEYFNKHSPQAKTNCNLISVEFPVSEKLEKPCEAFHEHEIKSAQTFI
jgi:hypothetical protein